MKDKVFVCQRCQVRLEKNPTFSGVAFKWTENSFKGLKLKFKQLFGKKPDRKVILTSCLGHCPLNAIAYEEAQGGSLKGFSEYSPEASEEEVFKLIFK
jgi:hypothetical protein